MVLSLNSSSSMFWWFQNVPNTSACFTCDSDEIALDKAATVFLTELCSLGQIYAQVINHFMLSKLATKRCSLYGMLSLVNQYQINCVIKHSSIESFLSQKCSTTLSSMSQTFALIVHCVTRTCSYVSHWLISQATGGNVEHRPPSDITEIYSWGSNSSNQITQSSTEKFIDPICMSHFKTKIIQVHVFWV